MASEIWYKVIYGDTGFASILYTFVSGIGGTAQSLIYNYLVWVLPISIGAAAIFYIIIWFPFRSREKKLKLKAKGKFRLFPFNEAVSVVISVLLSVSLVLSAMWDVGFFEWYKVMNSNTDFYEKEYKDPATVDISFEGEKRNLVYIFMESMEITYMSEKRGGAEQYNLIPELYNLAVQNTNFSKSNGVGGWSPTSNTSWTVASLVAQTAGIPLNVPINGNTYGENANNFLPGAYTMMEILKSKGYYQTIMMGSDSNFAGRKKYFEQHGINKVYDLYTARESKIIPNNYYKWWGFEDKYLYKYAKQELTEVAKLGTPFSFMMLTADTHHIGGYYCSKCKKSKSGEQYDSVISCASRQVYSFIKWLEKQDFYKNTTIVICGDHNSMDNEYFSRRIKSGYERQVYNCIINPAVKAENSTKGRTITPMDMLPTTLAAVGATIEGNRLGLGVNLFSKLPTLAERYGMEEFNAQLGGNIKYYMKEFM